MSGNLSFTLYPLPFPPAAYRLLPTALRAASMMEVVE